MHRDSRKLPPSPSDVGLGPTPLSSVNSDVYLFICFFKKNPPCHYSLLSCFYFLCFLKTEKLNTGQNKPEQNKRKTKNQKKTKKKVRTEIGLRNHYHRFFHSFIHSLIHSFHPFSLSFFISSTQSSYSHRTIL